MEQWLLGRQPTVSTTVINVSTTPLSESEHRAAFLTAGRFVWMHPSHSLFYLHSWQHSYEIPSREFRP